MNAPLFAKFADLAEARLRLSCRPDDDPQRAETLLRSVVSFADQHSLKCLRRCATDIAARHPLSHRRDDTLSPAMLPR